MRPGACVVILVPLLAGHAALAGFETPMRCSGPLLFYNDDGSFETYALELDLGPQSYSIRSKNIRESEIITDAGACGDYLTADGCRHAWTNADSGSHEYYDFRMESRDDGGYAYRETWWDGYSGETVLHCVALDAAAPEPTGE
ncbi:hypothetical protein [Tropicibacter sp. S64]|uniref:hypothetical protein n=1 Tax=Tropicibacter sp. S64 TaxID=3415122 RepID=UPI003C798291